MSLLKLSCDICTLFTLKAIVSHLKLFYNVTLKLSCRYRVTFKAIMSLWKLSCRYHVTFVLCLLFYHVAIVSLLYFVYYSIMSLKSYRVAIVSLLKLSCRYCVTFKAIMSLKSYRVAIVSLLKLSCCYRVTFVLCLLFYNVTLEAIVSLLKL